MYIPCTERHQTSFNWCYKTNISTKFLNFQCWKHTIFFRYIFIYIGYQKHFSVDEITQTFTLKFLSLLFIYKFISKYNFYHNSSLSILFLLLLLSPFNSFVNVIFEYTGPQRNLKLGFQRKHCHGHGHLSSTTPRPVSNKTSQKRHYVMLYSQLCVKRARRFGVIKLQKRKVGYKFHTSELEFLSCQRWKQISKSYFY
jgi:hypothetical protein